MNTEKFKGVFPAFYACYDDNGEISAERTQLLAKHLMEKGVKGCTWADLRENVFTRV